MKLKDVEALFEAGQFSDELVEEFRKALRRVHGTFLRTQHCYTPAVSMPKENYLQAVAMIRLGLEEYAADDHDRMRSYENLGHICERAEDYPAAIRAYRTAMEIARDSDHQWIRGKDYDAWYARLLMKVEKKAKGFVYSPELREYYELARRDEVGGMFADAQLDQALTEVILHDHEGDTEKSAEARRRAEEVLSPEYEGPMKAVLARHRYADSPKATAQALAFLNARKEEP